MAKEKPILFSTPMVQAILSGRKSMTRRVAKLPKWLKIQQDGTVYGGSEHDFGLQPNIKSAADYWQITPYNVGDILWVRETWCDFGGNFWFKANAKDCAPYTSIKWRPSIFMPHEAARIILRVTNVRVERLQDISVQDAKDEGIKVHANGCKDGLAFGCYNGDDCVYNRCKRPIEYFHELWESINAKRGYGWDTNPWVWVVEFERCEKPEDI